MRLLLATLFIVMFAGCVDSAEPPSIEFDTPIEFESNNCFGSVLIVAVDASILPLPRGLDLQPAVNFFNNPSHPDIMVLMGIKCEQWEEATSGVLLAGRGWTIYPMTQAGDGPFRAERTAAGWPTQNGSITHTPRVIESATLGPRFQHSTTDAYVNGDGWFTLAQARVTAPDAEMQLRFTQKSSQASLTWQGDVSLSTAQCLVHRGVEAEPLGLLGCDSHSTLALQLSGETLQSSWTQTI